MSLVTKAEGSSTPYHIAVKMYRTSICGHVVEARLGELLSEQVLVDGRIVSSRPFAGLVRGSHFFDLEDERGDRHHVEVRRVDLSKIGLGRYRMVITVDGIERCRLEPIDPSRPPP